MNVLNLLSHEAPPAPPNRSTPAGTQHSQYRAHQYPTRQSTSNTIQSLLHEPNSAVSPEQSYNDGLQNGRLSYDASIATSSLPKNVAFELLFDGPNVRARLPMRVQIFPHDTTDSIVTTVKNFYGLYDGATTGVSFEDDRGNTLIASYENLRNDMVVSVRVIPDYTQHAFHQHGHLWNPPTSISPSRPPHLEEAFQMPPPVQLIHHNAHEPISRPGSRVARKRSASPRASRSRRSVSAQKHHARSGIKSRDTSLPRTVEEPASDAVNFYSDSDGGTGSVTSSRKARNEQLASAEISVNNIVEGGRRKRAKFESSVSHHYFALVPAANSISSTSPQRRSYGQENASPFARPPQRQNINQQTLPSPQSYGHSEYHHGIVSNNAPYAMLLPASHGHRLRDRSYAPRLSGQGTVPVLSRPQAFGILPTPDPTVASCISDEDVALQLMRLGDASNISHGRTSASTLDDALSGRAEIASSASSDGDDESEHAESSSVRLPRMQPGCESTTRPTAYPEKGRGDQADSGLPIFSHTLQNVKDLDGEYQFDERKDGLFKSDPDDIINEFEQMEGEADSKTSHVRSNASLKRLSKPPKQRSGMSQKRIKIPPVPAGPKLPPSPASVAPHSRKTSSASTLNFQHHLGLDEEDLSSKPRCQRCRKSKKGCDRQRPCQRCKDAGISIEGCVSEDEGNGRKGRFGRHMGVSVKKDMPAALDSEVAGTVPTGLVSHPDKSKKRKR
ncbi:MAG: hypothetical protein Q9171_006202 [Xanthocarpia ochracea]